MKKTTIITALAALGFAGMSTTASAALTTLSVLNFDTGIVVCNAGAGTPPDNCTYGTNVPTGSYFGMDTSGNGAIENGEKNAISQTGGVNLGAAQAAGAIDNTWSFGGNTGNHFTAGTLAIVDDGAVDGIASLDGTNWRVEWNGGDINMGSGGSGTMAVVCGNECAVGDTYVLDYSAVVPTGGFKNFFYTLHLEGTVSAVPVPAAVWLFGSGLLGLVGVARRKRQA